VVVSEAPECLPAELIVRYVEGTLGGDDRASVERHADSCPSCRVALSELAAGSLAPRSTVGEASDAPEVEVAAGTAVGRYIVLYRIGRGGMATVYAAFDPELDRKVALKVLRGRGDRDHDRLRREARTLAALVHPHVVTVFDVGVHDGLLFIAMEFVEGETLREWMARGPRTWRELAPVFLGAARALSAAHAKGIVHRDVKPENLLLDRDGVVHVGDFGLAAIGHVVEVAGTPAYMAPEQLDGEATEQSDQYSFCVTLFEAIFGERPKHARVPSKTGVPRAVTDAIRRGLAETAADRHASMAALEQVLATEPVWRRQWFVLGVAGAIAAAGIAIVVGTRDSGAECSVAGEAARAKWTAQREAVRKAFGKAEPAFAAVDRGMSKYLDAWAAMSEESCERTNVRGDQSASLLDLRTKCLDRNLAAATALVDVLAQAKTPSVVEGAVTAVAGLPPIAACADVDALTAIVPPADARIAKQIAALDEQLAKAAALQLTGQHADAAKLVAPVLKDVTALDYAPSIAKAKHLDGDLQYRAGDYAASAAALTEATQQAARGRDDRTATKALTLLAGVIGYAQGKPDQGIALAIAADAWSARAGRVPEDEAELADIRGLLHDAKGEPLLARPFYEHALALREKLYGADHVMVALSLNNLAGVPYQLGKLDEARAMHERALKIRESTLGPMAADVAVSVNAIAAVDEDAGKLDDAERGYRRALKIWEGTLGAEHPDLAAAHNNLGNLLRAKGDHANAVAELERALAIWPPEHPNGITALRNLGLTYYEQKDFERALKTFTTAIERTRAVLGDQHPMQATALVHRGRVFDVLGRHSEAAKDLVTAVKTFEAVVPAGDRRLAWALTVLGKHELGQKRNAAAIAPFERAIAILEADKEAPPEELAFAREGLAQARGTK
jgi:tetratricopeptide (TPR) repeat protein/tRNA A-37 threonylcarbamoyl transferase component Bud32